MSTEPIGESRNPASDLRSLAAPLIEHAPLPMVEVEGPEHRVCFVNEPFCRLLNKTREELVGQIFSELVRDGEKCAALLDRIYQTGAFETHVETDHSVGELAYWLYAMWPALGADERPERVVIQLTKSANYHQNVSAMNEALLIAGLREHELREAAEKLTAHAHAEIAVRVTAEAALREANTHLLRATGVAELASRAKDDFLAALSHELRTPLTPVLMAVTGLREDPRLPPDVRAQLSMMERNITLEARLIDDLLDLTKISQGKLNLRPEACDAHSLIGLAIEIVQEDAANKGVIIERVFTAHHSGLVADPARFQQIVWNLLRNAVKFTPPGGHITIRTADDPRPGVGEWLRIEVVDTGIGIEPGRLDQIFLPFDQGGLAIGHRFGGMGLGLAIARAVVVMHGGRITAQSQGPNRGATFVVELPGAVDAPLGVVDPAAASSGNLAGVAVAPAITPIRPLRILMVEDHLSTLNVLSLLLRRDGHRVVTAATTAEALAAAAVNTFDLVVSDLGLPDGSGTSLMAILRTAYGLRGIALSGYGMEDDIVRSRDAGFVTHLVKPIATIDLRRAIAAFNLTVK
jgi:signal transduction histidine kinase